MSLAAMRMYGSLRSCGRGLPSLRGINAAMPAITVGGMRLYSGGALSREDVISRIVGVLSNFEKVDPKKVTAEAHFIKDLGLDSLDTVEVVMAFEEEFSIEIPDADAEKIFTAKDAADYILSNKH
eukprot:Opistho-2@74876